MKLLNLLKTLQPEEYKELEQFLQSHLHKRGERYVKFLKQLLKQYPDLDAAKADMEHLYRRCFSQEVYTDSKLYNLLSNMSREVEDFLVVSTVLENRESPEAAHLRRELLIKALKKRSAQELLLKEAQNLIDEIQSSPLKSAEDYLSLHQIHHLLYFSLDTPKYIEPPINLLAAMENIDTYHRIQKLRFVAEMKAREQIFGIPFNAPQITPFLEQAQTAGPTPLSAIYCSLIRLYLHGFKEAEFKHVKTVFLDSFLLLPKMDQLNLFLHLVNCGISLSAKDCAVEEDMLALYKKAIDEDILLIKVRISKFTFVNIATFAAMCGEFDWAKNFITTFSPCLEDDNIESIINFSHSYIRYYQGDLDAAQHLLTADIFSLPGFEVVARGLLLKIVFDRFIKQGKDYDFLLSCLQAHEKFISRRLFSDEKKAAQLNYARFIRKLATLKFEQVQVSEKDKETLRKKLERLNPVVSKRWLSKRIDLL